MLTCVVPNLSHTPYVAQALVDMHGADEGLGGKLSDDEVQIICGECSCALAAHLCPR